MKVTLDCIPCYIVQCKNALLRTELPKEEQFEILHNLLPIIPNLDINKTPAENSSVILHKMVDLIGGIDPYLTAKEESNKLAESYFPTLEKIIEESVEPLFTALKLSVAGNVIDLGIFKDYDLEAAINDVMSTDFKINNFQEFKEMIKSSDSILIIGDNSGEIVFDKILLRELKKNVTYLLYGVKSSFVINDATIEDAKQIGINSLARVIPNGSNYLGTLASRCSDEFLEAMDKADIIISKGQANYETLEGTELAGAKTFFLLKAKCPVVADNLGVNYGDIVFKKNEMKEF